MSARLTTYAALALSLGAGGCGQLGTPDRGADPDRPYRLLVPPATVGSKQIERAAPGSPKRAFLAWFGALQRRDVEAAAKL